MKLITVLAAMLTLSFNSLSYAESFNENDILGYWLSESGKGVIEIYRAGEKFEGKIVWVKDLHEGVVDEKLDHKNPKKELQTRSILGLKNLQGFTFKKSKWKDGSIYDPAKGKTYSSYMTLEDKDTLKLRGYIGIALLGRTSVMKRQRTAIPDSYTN